MGTVRLAPGPSYETLHRSGLPDLVVHSSVCKAAPKDISWRFTIGFEFRIWCDLCWHLYWCFIIDLGLCWLNWQPVTLNRAIGDLLSNYCSRTGNGLETFRCARRGNHLVHRH